MECLIELPIAVSVHLNFHLETRLRFGVVLFF